MKNTQRLSLGALLLAVMLVLGSTLGNVMPGSLAAPNIMAANILDPEYTGLVSSMSGWVQTYRAALYIRAWYVHWLSTFRGALSM